MFRNSLITFTLIAFLTAGCASGSRHHDAPPPAPAPAPSPTAVMEQALVEIRAVQPVDCTITFVVDDSAGSMWSQYNLNGAPGVPGPGCTGQIKVSTWMLGRPYDQIRGLLAHEIGHLLDGDDAPARLAQINAGTLTHPQIEQQADLMGATILKRISVDACMALPRLFADFTPDPNHPAPADRIAYTTAACQS